MWVWRLALEDGGIRLVVSALGAHEVAKPVFRSPDQPTAKCEWSKAKVGAGAKVDGPAAIISGGGSESFGG